jgi:hypothetical protein
MTRLVMGFLGILEAIERIDAPRMMYNLSVAVVATYLVGDGRWVVHNVACLVLGEEADVPYARWLASKHTNWTVSGTRYGQGSQNLVETSNNLKIIDNVDGTQLSVGRLTGTQQYDHVVFNAPRADAPARPPGPHRDLIVDILNDAFNVLTPKGTVRISSSTGMPAGWFLQGLATGNPKSTNLLPSAFTFTGGKGAPTKGRSGIPFLSDTDFGWPDYVPLQSGGAKLNISIDEISWYIFTLNR